MTIFNCRRSRAMRRRQLVEHRVVQHRLKVEIMAVLRQDFLVVRLDLPVSRAQNLRRLRKAAPVDVVVTEMAVVQIEDNT